MVELEIAFNQVAEQVAAEVQATFGDTLDRLFNDFAGDHDDNCDVESNHAAGGSDHPLASIAAPTSPGFYRPDAHGGYYDGYYSEGHDEDQDVVEHEEDNDDEDDDSDKDWTSDSEAKGSDDEHDSSEDDSMSEDEEEDEHYDDDVVKE